MSCEYFSNYFFLFQWCHANRGGGYHYRDSAFSSKDQDDAGGGSTPRSVWNLGGILAKEGLRASICMIFRQIGLKDLKDHKILLFAIWQHDLIFIFWIWSFKVGSEFVIPFPSDPFLGARSTHLNKAGFFWHLERGSEGGNFDRHKDLWTTL